jgi:hypothetical protein
MANYIDPTRIDAAAERMTALIPRPEVRFRVQRLLADALRNDPRSARAPTKRQLEKAPPWAAERLAAGEAVHVFRVPSRQATVAARIVSAVALATAPFKPLSRCEQRFADEQRLFIAKVSRMCLGDVERAAEALAKMRQELEEDRTFRRPTHAAETIAATPGRVWTIIEAPIDLTQIGEALQNCLRRNSTHFAGYAREMQNEISTFWALRDHGAIVAAIRVRHNLLAEFRAKGNTAPAGYLKDLAFPA